MGIVLPCSKKLRINESAHSLRKPCLLGRAESVELCCESATANGSYASCSIRLQGDTSPLVPRTLRNSGAAGNSLQQSFFSSCHPAHAVFTLLNLSPEVRKKSEANGKQILKRHRQCFNGTPRRLSKLQSKLKCGA